MTTAPDLATALRAADAADAVTLPRFCAPDLAVGTKADATVVTEADRRAEQVIREVIGREAPNDAILGEEYGSDGEAARRWIVDPIDATVNFVRGVPVWGTLIALEIDGAVTCGVVSAPALGMRWWAHRGGGAWCNGRRISVSGVTDLAEAHLSLNSLDGFPPARLDAAMALSRQCSRTRGFGDFWAFMLLAEGGVDIVVEPVAAIWDLAPLTVIVEEAGGRFTSLDGSPGIDHGHALATNGHLHPAALASLAS